MNRLALCKRLRSEAGIAGSGPSTTISQTGELGRIVDWIDEAYEDIQDKHNDWYFLRNDFSFNCVVGTSSYPTSTVTNLSNWKPDSFRCYLTSTDNETWLNYWSWDNFRDSRLMGPNRTATGMPIDFTIKPDKTVVLWPIPDDTYTIDGEFYRSPLAMTLDADTPVFDRYNMAIVYNALMRYAAYSAEPSLFANAQKEYGRLIAKLEREHMPMPTTGGSLA